MWTQRASGARRGSDAAPLRGQLIPVEAKARQWLWPVEAMGRGWARDEGGPCSVRIKTTAGPASSPPAGPCEISSELAPSACFVVT
jgi:hypothetical protein